MNFAQAVEKLYSDNSSSISSSEEHADVMGDSDSEEEDTLDTERLVIFLTCIGKKRAPKWQLDRLDWARHVGHQTHTDEFCQKYRMSVETFNKLCGILRPYITVDCV